MRRRSALAIGTALAMLIVPLVVAPASARSEHDRIVAYWTPSRMAAAQPRDLKPVGVKAVPNAKPGHGGGGGVTGASWTGGGKVLDLTGKVFFHMGGGDWQCSGSIVNDGSRTKYSVVLTAGHCAIDETTGEYASNWLFMPNWDRQPATFTTACSGSYYGCWTAVGIYVHYGFAHAGAFNNQAVTHDWGFAVVDDGGKPGQPQTKLDDLGSYPIQFLGGVSSGNRLEAFGYPAAGKYHGNDLSWCAGNIFVDVSSSNGSSTNATWGMPCDMTGGSSGGPWFEGLTESGGQAGNNGMLSSLNSYGYSGIRNMYGPKFNSNTQATYSEASTTTNPTNTTVGNTP